MRDILVSGVKTAVQAITASIVALAAGWEIILDPTQVEGVLSALFVGIVTLVLNYLSTKISWLDKLLSLGLSSGSVSYQENAA